MSKSQLLVDTAAAGLGHLEFVSWLFALVSLFLTGIGVVLIVGGIYALINFRAIARQHAKTEARNVAHAVAARIAEEKAKKEAETVARKMTPQVVHNYLQNNLATIVGRQLSLTDSSEIGDKAADEMTDQTKPGPEAGGKGSV